VRTYARLGLGYATALAALPGFYIGYLPYTLYKDQIDAVVFGDALTDFITIPEYLAYTFSVDEVILAWGYSLVMIAILVFSFGNGWRFLRVPFKDLLRKNTDELVFPEGDKKTVATRSTAETT
jgi:hypothetical protein